MLAAVDARFLPTTPDTGHASVPANRAVPRETPVGVLSEPGRYVGGDNVEAEEDAEPAISHGLWLPKS